MKTFALLVLCFVGCVAKKKDGEKVGLKWGIPGVFDYAKCEGGDGACGYCSSHCDEDKGCQIIPEGEGCVHDKNCAKGLYCAGAITINCGGKCKPATKKDGERVSQDRPFHYDYNQCAGGDGACGFCSSTCDTEDGCSIVPMRGPCVHDDDCQKGLYCDGGKNFITANCDGVCLTECKQFNNKDQSDLCQGIEALDFSYAAYTYADHYCCNDGGNYHFSETECKNEEVKREDCIANPECKAGCAKMYGESHSPEDITVEEWDSNVGQLLDLKRHEAHLDRDDNMFKGDPFGFTAYVGSTIVVAFKGSEDAGDFAADADFAKSDFTVSKSNGESEVFVAHKGFVRYYSSIRESVLNEVERLIAQSQQNGNPCKELLLSGHSLGGAMANLCSVDLAAKYPQYKVSLWTYGNPRVFAGNTKAKENKESAYNAHILQTTNGNTNHRYMADGDPVPVANLENFGFMHCGDGLELHGGGFKKCKHCGIDHVDDVGAVSSHFKSNYHKIMVDDCPARCGTRNAQGVWQAANSHSEL